MTRPAQLIHASRWLLFPNPSSLDRGLLERKSEYSTTTTHATIAKPEPTRRRSLIVAYLY